MVFWIGYELNVSLNEVVLTLNVIGVDSKIAEV